MKQYGTKHLPVRTGKPRLIKKNSLSVQNLTISTVDGQSNTSPESISIDFAAIKEFSLFDSTFTCTKCHKPWLKVQKLEILFIGMLPLQLSGRYCQACSHVSVILPTVIDKDNLEQVRKLKAKLGIDTKTSLSQKEKPKTIITPRKQEHVILPQKKEVLVVQKNMYRCIQKNHIIESFTADIPVLGKNNSLQHITVDIQYCTKDKRFFIYESEFREKLYNHIDPKKVLKTFRLNSSGKQWGMTTTFSNLSQQSPLNLVGYNVNQQSNLSSTMRHEILDYIIEYRILSVTEIKDYLNYFIFYLGQRPQNKEAKFKWKEDLNYLTTKYSKNYTGNHWFSAVKFKNTIISLT